MSDAPVVNESANVSAVGGSGGSPKVKKSKAAGSATKKPRVKPNHPPTSEMVNNAIKNLKERGGSSLQAIKKYISANYKIDADKLSPFIKKYLKGAVTGGQLVQTKGKGASGSFKLAATSKGPKVSSEKKKVKKSSAEKSTKSKKPSSSGKPKKSSVKKSSEKKKIVAAGSAKSVKKSGSGVKSVVASKQKPTKAKSSSPKKPKTPKPKKAVAPKKAAAATKKSVKK